MAKSKSKWLRKREANPYMLLLSSLLMAPLKYRREVNDVKLNYAWKRNSLGLEE